MFDTEGEGKAYNTGAWFTSSKRNAKSYNNTIRDGGLYAVFLNIRNPYIFEANGRNWSQLGEIYIRDKAEDTMNYLVLTAWDTDSPDSTPSRISLLGRSDNLYCSEDTLFVADTKYIWDETSGVTSTDLYAFTFSGTELYLQAKGSIPGVVKDQYSMDQYHGVLRVTTTDSKEYMDEDSYEVTESSNLYTLDRDLNVIGKLEDLADNEEVKSTRFFGDTAYVVTYENTDPLFVIDLSDPANPAVKGELKLPQAVVCANDYMAYGLIDKFDELGIKEPDDVTVVGYEFVGDRFMHQPLLTTYKRNRESIGEDAANMVYSRLKKREFLFSPPRGEMICGTSGILSSTMLLHIAFPRTLEIDQPRPLNIPSM